MWRDMVILEDGDGGARGAEVEDAVKHAVFIGFFIVIFLPAAAPKVKDRAVRQRCRCLISSRRWVVWWHCSPPLGR